MKNVAIIPARGGSKRFPNKNIAIFNGKPLIAWTIEAALEADIFDEIIVTSDSNAILDAASTFPIQLNKRPKNLSSDEITVDTVCLNLLNQLNMTEGTLACLYATAPLRRAEDICNVFALVSQGTYKKAYAVTTFDLPVNQAAYLNFEQKLSPLFPNLLEKRNEDIDKIVVDNGSTYVADIYKFRCDRSFISGKCGGYEMPKNRSIDINYKEDLDIIKCLNDEKLRGS